MLIKRVQHDKVEIYNLLLLRSTKISTVVTSDAKVLKTMYQQKYKRNKTKEYWGNYLRRGWELEQRHSSTNCIPYSIQTSIVINHCTLSYLVIPRSHWHAQLLLFTRIYIRKGIYERGALFVRNHLFARDLLPLKSFNLSNNIYLCILYKMRSSEVVGPEVGSSCIWLQCATGNCGFLTAMLLDYRLLGDILCTAISRQMYGLLPVLKCTLIRFAVTFVYWNILTSVLLWSRTKTPSCFRITWSFNSWCFHAHLKYIRLALTRPLCFNRSVYICIFFSRTVSCRLKLNVRFTWKTEEVRNTLSILKIYCRLLICVFLHKNGLMMILIFWSLPKASFTLCG